MKYTITCLLLVFWLISCENNTPDQTLAAAPLSEQQMVGVLIDIHMAESALSIKNYNRDSSLLLFQFYKKEIYANRHITEQQFQESYAVYAKSSDVMDRMYAAVIDSLSVRESGAAGK